MDKNFYKVYFEAEKRHWWFRVREKFIFYLLKKYSLKSLPSQLKVLDFGCGSGMLTGKLQNAGYQALGVDISNEAIAYGISQSVKNLSCFDGNHLEFADKSFNFILALDVLEHVENEKPVLTEFARVLAEGGIAIVSVPAYMFLWGVQDEISHHFRRYTLTELVKLIDSNVFEVVRKTYSNTLLFLPIMAVRLFSRWFKIKSRQSDFLINPRFLNKLFYGIFSLETGLLKLMNFPFGVSILLVLRKK